jgi:hypothetical protein
MMIRTIAVAALGFLLLMADRPAPAFAGSTATATSAASVSVPVPQAARNASVAMLELSLRARGTGNLGGVVRLGRGGNAVEIGRFTAGGAGEQRFQFNVTLALRHLDLVGGSATVEVAVIDRAGGPAPSGASLTVSSARIIAR